MKAQRRVWALTTSKYHIFRDKFNNWKPGDFQMCFHLISFLCRIFAEYACRYVCGDKKFPEAIGNSKKEAKEAAAKLVHESLQNQVNERKKWNVSTNVQSHWKYLACFDGLNKFHIKGSWCKCQWRRKSKYPKPQVGHCYGVIWCTI